MNQVAIGVGSNIEPEKNVAEAIHLIGRTHRVVGKSQLVKTKPVGYSDQSDFLNGVIRIETDLDVEALTTWLRNLEDRLGRVRMENRYGPRTIDLDIVVWNGKIVDEDVYRRDFLRQGLREVWPDLEI